MDRAAGLDAAADEGMPAGGLAGVPVGIKDLIDHEGRITTAGSAFYRHEGAILPGGEPTRGRGSGGHRTDRSP